MSQFQFSQDLCQELALWVVEQAKQDGLTPVSCAIINQYGELNYLVRMDNAPARTIAISQGKAYTSVRMLCTTQAFRERLDKENILAADFMDEKLCGLPGGVPLYHNGVCVGAVGISGRSLPDDHLLASAAADHFAKLVE